MTNEFQVSVSSLPGDTSELATARRWLPMLVLAVVLTVAAASAGLLVGS